MKFDSVLGFPTKHQFNKTPQQQLVRQRTAATLGLAMRCQVVVGEFYH